MSQPSNSSTERTNKGDDPTPSRNEARLRLKSYYQIPSGKQEPQETEGKKLLNSVRSSRVSVLSPISSAFNMAFKAARGGGSAHSSARTVTKPVQSNTHNAAAHAPTVTVASSNKGTPLSEKKTGNIKRHSPASDSMTSQDFNPKSYLRRALRDKPIKELLIIDNQLVSGIRNIDSDMKTMVYENYSQFINATDAIKQVNQNLVVMDSEMTKLTKKVDGMVTRATEISGPLAQRSQKIHKLATTHKLLRKLQFLYDVPNQLSAFISRGELTAAAQLWARAQPLFDRYRQLGAFAGLERDGKAIVVNIESAVWSRWKNPETDLIEGVECVALLVMLSPERVGELWDAYIEIQSQKLLNLCHQLLQPSTQQLKPGSPASKPNGGGDGSQVQKISGQRLRSEKPMLILDNGLGIKHSTRRNSIAHVIESFNQMSKFNGTFLPMWNATLLGFLLQFIPPENRTCMNELISDDLKGIEGQDGNANSELQQRIRSFVDILSTPNVTKDSAGNKVRQPFVPAWQMMSKSEHEQAQSKLDVAIQKWAETYELAISPMLFILNRPLQNGANGIDYVDELILTARRHSLLVEVGRLGVTVENMVKEWQSTLIEAAIDQLMAALVGKITEYFQKIAFPPSARYSLLQRDDNTTFSRYRGSRVNRPHSFSSGTYLMMAQDQNTSGGDDNTNIWYHHRSSSPRQSLTRSLLPSQHHRRATSSASSPSLETSARPQRSRSFKTVNNTDSLNESTTTQESTRRHARMASGSFSYATSSPSRQIYATLPASPMLWAMKASTVAYEDQSPREFLTRLETWFIEHVLSTFSPLIESVAQHYISYVHSNPNPKPENQDSLSDKNTVSANNTASLSVIFSRLLSMLVLVTREHLNAWLSKNIRMEFFEMADIDGLGSPDTTDSHTKDIKTPLSACFDDSENSDPLIKLLLSQLCIDFDQSLTRNIYQFCEQALAVARDRGSNTNNNSQHSSRTNSLKDSSPLQTGLPSVFVTPTQQQRAAQGSNTLPKSTSVNSLPMHSPILEQPEIDHERIEITVDSDILSTKYHQIYDPVASFSLNTKACSESWRSSAQVLAQAYIKQTGYQLVVSYIDNVVTTAQSPGVSSPDGELSQDNRGSISVSQHWIDLCKVLKQIEADTIDLFYDSIFSSARTSAAQSTASANDEVSEPQTPAKLHRLVQNSGGGGDDDDDKKVVRNPSNLGLSEKKVKGPSTNKNPSKNTAFFSDFFSTIDELFGEHIDDQPLKAEDLKAVATHQASVKGFENEMPDPEVVNKVVKSAWYIVNDMPPKSN
ncbi:hypothetical protein H4219_002256 [Mycoemilia scoparia]|uniref:Vacuolar protein sorting-associated protein 51 homolog n=1 Tax=Mycoemilia scoparia TaxID=417184 RepID=A0A9W8A3T4_9FUNG|nr:hypothetical protein H4219_002256 [Mycoemilia scoparia]